MPYHHRHHHSRFAQSVLQETFFSQTRQTKRAAATDHREQRPQEHPPTLPQNNTRQSSHDDCHALHGGLSFKRLYTCKQDCVCEGMLRSTPISLRPRARPVVLLSRLNSLTATTHWKSAVAAASADPGLVGSVLGTFASVYISA